MIDKSLSTECWMRAYELVQSQADDEGLWFIAETCAEQYLQDALRALHRAIEGELPVATPPKE